jgi:hypothetical protein
MATTLRDLVNRIYVIGIPKQEDFLLIMLMNVMSSAFTTLRNHIADCINASTDSNPYTSFHALKRLDMEQQLLDSEKQHHSGGITLTATTSGKHIHKHLQKCTVCTLLGHNACCTNCGTTGHVYRDCWREGGGHAGERDQILAEKCASKTARTTSKPSGAPVTHQGGTGTASTTKALKGTVNLRYDTTGCVYILDGTTGEAVFIAHPSTAHTMAVATVATASVKFTGLACDPIMPAFICEATAADLEEYDALLLHTDLKASVDW